MTRHETLTVVFELRRWYLWLLLAACYLGLESVAYWLADHPQVKFK